MTVHRAAVCGSPIRHSLSPVLHSAAYRALGLTDWTYDRVELSADELAPWVAGLDESWRGLSLTMPLKEAAFAVAQTVTELARMVGSINTLVRTPSEGWSAHNTDVVGIERALAEAGLGLGRDAAQAVIVGAGATARSALAALSTIGVTEVVVMVRASVRRDTHEVASRLGVTLDERPLGAWPEVVDVVIGTVPPQAYAGALADLPPARAHAAILDCVYGHGPSPLLTAATLRGYAAVSGTEMLLHQAAEQVHLMTGHVAPVAAMRAALRDALAGG